MAEEIIGETMIVIQNAPVDLTGQNVAAVIGMKHHRPVIIGTRKNQQHPASKSKVYMSMNMS